MPLDTNMSKPSNTWILLITVSKNMLKWHILKLLFMGTEFHKILLCYISLSSGRWNIDDLYRGHNTNDGYHLVGEHTKLKITFTTQPVMEHLVFSHDLFQAAPCPMMRACMHIFLFVTQQRMDGVGAEWDLTLNSPIHHSMMIIGRGISSTAY